MGKYLGSLVFAGTALIAPPLSAAPSVSDHAPVEASPAVAVQQVRISSMGLHDGAAMVLVGTALIGLAAAVRRAA